MLSVDEAIEKTTAQVAKLKDLKTRLMQELLSRGIGHSEFKDSPVGRIPVEWEVFSIGELLKKGIIESIQEGNHGAIHPKLADFTNKGIPFVMASNLHNGIADLAETNNPPESIYNSLHKALMQDLLTGKKRVIV